MPPPLPYTVRQDITELFVRGDTTDWIHYVTGVSISQVNKMRANWKAYDDVVAPEVVSQGRPCLMSMEIELDLLQLLKARPTAYLDEMCWFILNEYGVNLCP